jgi:EmrB/QacA subfamily drug resistance transporter
MEIEKNNKNKNVFIIIGVMVGILLAALDSNIVGTALPKIIGSLKGFDLYTWPVTAYLLSMTISMPIFGKLVDIYGFKPVYIFGIAIFLAGSVLCGLSQDMMQLILFRGLQGLGGAILFSTPLTIVSILFPPAQRAKLGGLISSASGVASLVGPFLGGYITDNLNWRWVFFINIPLGLIALIITALDFPANKVKKEHIKIDFAGALVLIVALIPMLLAFTWGGKNYAWNSFQIIGMLVFSVIMLIVFGIIETKAKDPMIPMSLFKKSVFNSTAIEMFLLNGILMICIIFIPLFLQGVKGNSASSSGAILTSMLVSLIIGVIVSGFIVSKICKYKLLSIIGIIIIGASTVLLSLIGINTSNSQVIVIMIIMGLGIGIILAIFNVTAQNVFPEQQLGIVTSTIQFFGRMGQTMASSILGTILSTTMIIGFQKLDVSKFPAQLAGQLKDANNISDINTINTIKGQIPINLLADFEKLIIQVKQILANSIHQIFIISIGVALIALVIGLFMREVPLSKKLKDEQESD